MLFLPLLYFYFVQVPNVEGLFDFIVGRQKVCICRCGLQRPVASSLMGGDTVAPNQFPWLVIVNAGATSHSGALVSDRHIVTSASRLYGVPVSDVSVVLGVRDRCGLESPPLSAVESVLYHPNYSPTSSANDIALIRLSNAVSFSDSVAPICLPMPGSDREGRVAKVASWGDFTDASGCVPKVASLPILESETCLTSAVNTSLVTTDKGCLGPVGTTSTVCSADVGAPVMTQWIRNGAFRLVGVISSTSCEETTTPLYTTVNDHSSWIRNEIRSDCKCF